MAIRKRRGKWTVRVYVDGSYRWIGTFESKLDARQAELEALSAPRTKGQETVESFCGRWLTDYDHQGTRWDEPTKTNYRSALKPFIAAFGQERLSRFPNEKARPWAASQPASVVRAVKACLNDAVPDLMPSNPFVGLRFERSRGRADIIALTEEEVYLLADCALAGCGRYGPTFRAFLIFQGFQGLRPIATGQIRRDDVQGESLYVRKPGKKVAPRTVYLFNEVREALASMPRTLGVEWLFTTPQGSSLSKTNLTYHWNRVRHIFEAKLDPRRLAELRDARPRGGSIELYELRHAAATIMLRRGLNSKQVAWQLGHTDGGMLVDKLYGHPTDQDRMAGVRNALSGTVDRSTETVRSDLGMTSPESSGGPAEFIREAMK